MKTKSYIFSRLPLILVLLLVILPAATLFAQLPDGAKGRTSTATPLPYSDYFTIRGGLGNFFTAVRAKKATVGFLGGSITFNPGWREMVCSYLRRRYPEVNFRFIDAAIPSLGSLSHAFRVQRDLLDSGRIDLMFLEAAVNDRGNGTDSITQVRCLEGIIRQAKTADPGLDVIMMAFADPDKTADYDRGVVPVEIANQELVAAYYGLPSINFSKEVHDKIRHGEFDWKLDFEDIHPAPFGQELYLANIKELLDTCSATWNARGGPVAALAGVPLSAPLDLACIQDGRYEDVRKARRKKDWTLHEDWSPTDNAATRPGFVHVPVLAAETAGAQLTLPFRGTAVGIAVVSGPDAGIVEYAVDKGPWRRINLYTQWSSWLHLPWYYLLGSALSEGRHVLRLRVSNDKDPKSKGNACRVVHFLVNSQVR